MEDIDCENTSLCLMNGGCGYSFCRDCEQDMDKFERKTAQDKADKDYAKKISTNNFYYNIKLLALFFAPLIAFGILLPDGNKYMAPMCSFMFLLLMDVLGVV